MLYKSNQSITCKYAKIHTIIVIIFWVFVHISVKATPVKHSEVIVKMSVTGGWEVKIVSLVAVFSLLVVLAASPLLKLNTCGLASGTGRSQVTVTTQHLGSSQCFSPDYTWNWPLLYWKVNCCRWKEQEECSSSHLKKNKRCVLSLFSHSPIKFCVYRVFVSAEIKEERSWGAFFWVVQWSV